MNQQKNDLKVCKSLITIIIVFNVLLFTQTNSQSTQLNNLLTQLQGKISKLTIQAQKYLSPTNNCTQQNIVCQIKSYNHCQGVSDRGCHLKFPTPEYCLNKGSYLSFKSSFRTPLNKKMKNLNQQSKQYICRTAELMEDALTALNDNRQQNYGLAFVSSAHDGVHRRYPSKIHDKDQYGDCVDYDPRQRPWYKFSTYAQKNIVIIVDVSYNMEQYKNKLIKKIQKIVKRLSFGDYLTIITFSDTAKIFQQVQLLSIQSLVAEAQFLKKINELQINSNILPVNYKSALQLGLNAINNRKKSENILLIISSLNDKTNDSQYLSLINYINTNFNVSTFYLTSFHMANKLFTPQTARQTNEAYFLSNLTRAFRGFSMNLNLTLDIQQAQLYSFQNFFKFIDSGVKNHTQWTEPFQDSFKYGQVIAITKPFHYTDENGITSVLGVAGIDVVFSSLLRHVSSREELLNKLLERNINNRIKYHLDYTGTDGDCKLWSLRPVQFRNQNFYLDISKSNISSFVYCNQAVKDVSLKCSFDPNSLEFTPISLENQFCCGLTKAAFVGIIVGAFVGFIIVLVITVIISMRVKQKWVRQQLQQQEQTQQNERRSSHLNPVLNNPPDQIQPNSNQELMRQNYVNIIAGQEDQQYQQKLKEQAIITQIEKYFEQRRKSHKVSFKDKRNKSCVQKNKYQEEQKDQISKGQNLFPPAQIKYYDNSSVDIVITQNKMKKNQQNPFYKNNQNQAQIKHKKQSENREANLGIKINKKRPKLQLQMPNHEKSDNNQNLHNTHTEIQQSLQSSLQIHIEKYDDISNNNNNTKNKDQKQN